MKNGNTNGAPPTDGVEALRGWWRTPGSAFEGDESTAGVETDAVLERARTLYSLSPRAYRGTRPLPWDKAPEPTRQEFIDKAKAEASRGVKTAVGGEQ